MTTNWHGQKNSLLMLAALVGCASNAPADESAAGGSQPNVAAGTADISLGTAVYGLTVRDCYAEATECAQSAAGDERPWAVQLLACQVELRSCLGEVVVETAGAVVEEARDVTQCGQDGLSCYATAEGLGATLDCRNAVEVCVNDNVEEITGIRLPTTRDIAGAAADAARAAVDSAVEVAEGVVERAVDRVETAVEVAQGAAQVASDIAEAVTAPARHAIGCTLEAQQCRFAFEDPRVCRREYRECLFGGAEDAPPAVVLQ